MPNKQSEISSASFQPSKPNGSITSETIDKLISEAEINQHPYGKAWPRFDCDTFADLCTNIQSRGMDQDILLHRDMILEGWHRYLACLHTNTTPRFVVFEGTDLQAAERVRASGVRRQSSADQRYAAFLMLGNACPEFRAKYEKLSKQGIEQKNAGTPLSTDGHRVDVLGTKAVAAGVSRATAAKLEKVNLTNPNAISEIASGNTSANKELKELKAKEKTTPGTKTADVGKVKTPKKDNPVAIAAVNVSETRIDKELKPVRQNEEAENTAENTELITVTANLGKLYGRLDHLDWSNECQDEWKAAIKGLNTIVEQISDKVREAFDKPKGTAIKGPVLKRPTKTKQTSEDLSIRKLKSQYGEYALDVLREYLEELPKEGRAMRAYKVIKTLPTMEKFETLQKTRYTSTVSEMICDAFSTFEELSSECSEWYDSLPESFKDSEKGSMLEEVSSTLENLQIPDCSETTKLLPVYYLPILDCSTRCSRRDDAVGRLQAVLDVLEEVKQDIGEEVSSLVDELENAISEAEGVEFPGMYG